MKKKLLIVIPAMLFTAMTLVAQKKIVVEKIQCFSMKGPVMLYWQSPDIKKTFIKYLDNMAQQYLGGPVADTTLLPVAVLDNAEQADRIKLDFNRSDTNQLHLFLTLYEYNAYTFFAYNFPENLDTNVVKRTKTVFRFNAILVNSRKQVRLNKTLDIFISNGDTPGMGIVPDNMAVTPKGFTEMLGSAMNLLLNPADETEMIEIKAVPAFLADNFILPFVAQQPRIYVQSKKGIARYTCNNKEEIMRLGESFYQNIRRKGKNPDKLPEAMITAINHTRSADRSDFVFLKQECRDVIRDKDYLLKLLVQMDPQLPVSNPAEQLKNFVDGDLQYLLRDRDTVAVFSITKKMEERGKKIFINKTWNGYDSSSVFTLNGQEALPLEYNYVIKGRVGMQRFSIKCSGNNTVKEIVINDRLACIAQGRFMPERFVIFDASLSTELLNQLFMIGFCRFYE